MIAKKENAEQGPPLTEEPRMLIQIRDSDIDMADLASWNENLTGPQ